MEIFLIIVGVIVAGTLFGLFWYLKSLRNSLGESLKNLNDFFSARISDVMGNLRENQASWRQTNESFHNLKSEVVKISETAKNIGDLKDIFSPKLRGNLGEMILYDLLKQILPAKNYETQYRFKNGEIADAVIKLQTKLVVIDAKFPLEAFQRFHKSQSEIEKIQAQKEFIKAVKSHIDDIKNKYILPDEGTLDLAFMYVPAENIYYEIIMDQRNGGLIEYAQTKKVLPASPNTLYAYLEAIARGLRGLEIGKQAEEILGHLMRLQADFRKFEERFLILGRHLNSARSAFEESEKKLARFQDKLSSLSSGQQTKLLIERGEESESESSQF